MTRPHSLRLLALSAAACLVMGCKPSTAPAPRETQDKTAASLSANGARENASEELDRFLDEKSRNIEQCFVGMPSLETDASSADLRAGEAPKAVPAGRLVMAIDASGSMAARIGDQPKMAAAKRAAADFLGSLPEGVSVGLLAFGHRGSNRPADRKASCAAAEAIQPIEAFNRQRVAAALDGFEARGWTPLAAAIEEAGRMLGPRTDGAQQAVYVVSDGKDTCGGDPIAAARALNAGGTRAIVNVIGFDLAATDRAELAEVARAGGGVFTEIKPENIASFGDELRRQNRNFSERLQASNANFDKRLRNSNQTFTAGLELKNCVSTRGLRESNDLYAWSRQQALSGDAEASLRAEFEVRQAAFEARAAAIVARAERAEEEANARLQSAQDAIDREAEAKR